MYGMTEAGLVLTIKEANKKKAGTCGSLAPGIQAKVSNHIRNALKPLNVEYIRMQLKTSLTGYAH